MGAQVPLSCSLKIFRLQILIKSSLNLVKKIIQPRGVFIPSYNSREISEEILTSVTGYFFIYFYFWFFISSDSIRWSRSSNIIVWCSRNLANVGPGLNEAIGPSGNYSAISDITKLFMCLGMLVGRLELFPILILLSPQLWKR